MAIILDLPAEIIQLVGKNIDYTDAQNLRLVCSTLCRSANPIALSKCVLSLKKDERLNDTLEKWIAYASKTATATANGYVQTLRIHYLGDITSFEEPVLGQTILRDDRDAQWYLAAPGLMRVGRLLVEILRAIPHLDTLEWHSNEGNPMNRFLLNHFKSLELVDLNIRLLGPATDSNIPEDSLSIGPQDAFRGLQTLKFCSWYNSDFPLLQKWLAETIRQSPRLISVDIYQAERMATDTSQSLEELLPRPQGVSEGEDQADGLPFVPIFPLQIEHLTLSGLRVSFDNQPHILANLKHLCSLCLGDILYGPPVGVEIKDLWKPLRNAGIYPERIEFNLAEVEDQFMDYLMTYPPNRLKCLKLDNREFHWQDRENTDKAAVRFYNEVLKAENVRDSLEELLVVTRYPTDNWCWGRVPGMIETIEACKKLTFEKLMIDVAKM